ncbi:MAG: LamG domain-containing protein, partial [Clostridia bacterium]|nr:LamG domain-containing protein [Clostridia bacterium]
MKKALILLSAVLLIAALAIPALAEFPLEDLTLPEGGLHFGFNGDAKDDSGAVVGELVGDPTFVEGRDGTANGAVYLDDNEQYIFLGKNVDAESYTAIFWAKVEDNTEHVFLCSSMLGSIRIIHDGGVYVGSTINGVVDNVSGYAAPRDEWVNLAFVYNGETETMDIYANGEFQDTLTGALPLPLTLLGNEASEQKGWQSYPFLTLDDAWFYGRAFTEDEVKAFYTETGGTASASSGAASGASSTPTLLWDFNEDELMGDSMGANSNNAVTFWGEKDDAGNDYFVFVAGGNDPYISVDLEAEDVSDVVWCKARVKNSGPATAIELFGHTDGRGLTGSECTHINLSTDGEWHTYIIYIPDENV